MKVKNLAILCLIFSLVNLSHASENEQEQPKFHEFALLPLDVQVYSLQFMNEPDKLFFMNKELHDVSEVAFRWAKTSDYFEKLIAQAVDKKKQHVPTSAIFLELNSPMELSMIKRLLGQLCTSKDRNTRGRIIGVLRYHIQSNVSFYRDLFIEISRKNKALEKETIKLIRTLSPQSKPIVHSKNMPSSHIPYIDKAVLESIESSDGNTVRAWKFPAELNLAPLQTISYAGGEDYMN